MSIVFFQSCQYRSGHGLGDTCQESTSEAPHEWEAQGNRPPVSHIPCLRPQCEAWLHPSRHVKDSMVSMKKT